MDLNSQQNDYAEMSVKAIVLGVILAMILAGANAYLGAFAGMTVSATIPASVISMGVLSLLFKRHTIFENTQVMTCASAGEALAAGVVFTVPALVIMGAWSDFHYWRVTAIAAFGGVLGVLFTIPLRRALIVESDLQFPEGIATAEVLKTGVKGRSAVKAIAWSAMAGALFKLGAAGLTIWKEVYKVAKIQTVWGKDIVAYFGTNLSPALLAVGYIVGLNIALLIFLGGAANWMIAIPICSAMELPVKDAAGMSSDLAYAEMLWEDYTRYIGVGAMVVGGLWAVIKIWKSIVVGVKSGLGAYKGGGSASVKVARTDKDVPMKWVLGMIVFSVVPLFFLYNWAVDGRIDVSLPMAGMMLVFGFLFSAVAGYMAGLVGSSNNPVSGVTVATVLLSSLLLFVLMGEAKENGPEAAIIIGVVICCAGAIAGDNLQDLKSGYLVKATPWKQEVMLIIGVLASAVVIAPILSLLFHAYGFSGMESKSALPNSQVVLIQDGNDELFTKSPIAKEVESLETQTAGAEGTQLRASKREPLPLPQANLMKAVAQGIFRVRGGELPWAFFGIGLAVAVVLIILDEILRIKGSSFRTPVLAVAIGFYLPFQLSVPILVGGLLSFLVIRYQKKKKMSVQQEENSNRTGLLFASGLITGEALMGILLAIPILVFKEEYPLSLMKDAGGNLMEDRIFAWPGIVLLVGIGLWLYRSTTKPKEDSIEMNND